MKQRISYNGFFIKKQQLLETMSSELPEHFEAVVLGTGLEESIVAGAIARTGHSVLHLDPNDFYGGEWASFNFKGLQDWVKSQKESQQDDDKFIEVNKSLLKDDEEFIPLNTRYRRFSDFEETLYSQEEEVECNEKNPTDELDDNVSNHSTVATAPNKLWSQERLVSESRKFNIDLVPKLLYTSGSLVDLLISSNVSRYLEFKALNRVLTTTPDGEGLDHVPSSRSDVFSTHRISVVEKRIMMKFLTFANNFEAHPEVYSDFINKTFLSFLKKEKLTPNLIHFLMNSIALVDQESDTLQGLRSTKKFLSSLGRFGSNTPYLWTVFGGGEIPQAFCRLCAVFGGTYYLGKSVQGIIRNYDGKVSGVILDGGQQRVSCNVFIANDSYLNQNLKANEDADKIYRSISIVKDSVLPTDTEKISMVSIPIQVKNNAFAFIQEVGHGAAICPKGLYVRHTTSKQPCEPFKFESRDSFVWNLRFSMKGKPESSSFQSPLLSNLFYTSGPFFELDYDENINNAKNIFKAIFPEDEFLPRAPDPEEIIIGDESSDKPPEDESKNSAQTDQDKSESAENSKDYPLDQNDEQTCNDVNDSDTI